MAKALSGYLTRAEWQLAFALSFAHQHLGAVEPFDSLGDELRYSVQYLGENGFEFAGLVLTTDGRLLPIEPEPFCQANLETCAAIACGIAPDYPEILRAAIDFGETAIPHLSHDLEMLRQTLAEVGEAAGEIRVASPEVRATLSRQRSCQ